MSTCKLESTYAAPRKLALMSQTSRATPLPGVYISGRLDFFLVIEVLPDERTGQPTLMPFKIGGQPKDRSKH